MGVLHFCKNMTHEAKGWRIGTHAAFRNMTQHGTHTLMGQITLLILS